MIVRLQAWIRSARLHDPLEQQQAYLVQVLLLALIIVSLLAIPLPFLTELPLLQALAVEAVVLLEIPLYIAALLLVRRDQFQRAVLLAGGSIVLLCVGLLLSTGTRSSGATMLAFALPVVFAGLLGGRNGVLWIAGLSLAGIAGVIALEIVEVPLVGFAAPRGPNIGGVLGGFLAITAVLGLFVARFGHALRGALRNALDREHELAEQRDNLEHVVGERTADLRSALTEVETRAATQAHLLEEIETQREIIRELSVPILPVDAHTLVLPLVGSLDSTRLHVLQERALQGAKSESVHRMILDISGVPVVDSQVAMGLLTTIRAARLLGVEVAVAGIRPEVAQALVSLGLDLHEVRAYRDLESALQYVR